MSQNDFSVANADGATVRADINSALQALASLSSGTSEPGTTYAGQIWWDTTNDLIKIRNGANNAWVDFANWDGSTLTFDSLAADSVGAAELANGAISGQTEAVITASDNILFGDVGDSDNLKRCTVQGILDLAGGGGGLELLATATASASAAIDFTSGIDGTYDEYIISILGLKPQTDATALWMRTSTNGGSSFDSGSGEYGWGYNSVHGAGADSAYDSGTSGDTKIQLSESKISSASGDTMNGIVRVFRPSITDKTVIGFQTFHVDADDGSAIYHSSGMGMRISAADVDAIRFFMSSGNISSGEFKLYGVKKSI